MFSIELRLDSTDVLRTLEIWLTALH